MRKINLYEAKTHLSRWVDEAGAGAELVIAKAGRPVARLVPLVAAKPARKPGFLKGRIRIGPDFDGALPETLLSAFEGRK